MAVFPFLDKCDPYFCQPYCQDNGLAEQVVSSYHFALIFQMTITINDNFNVLTLLSAPVRGVCIHFSSLTKHHNMAF